MNDDEELSAFEIWQRTLTDAFGILEQHPGFPAAQVQLMDSTEELNKQEEASPSKPATPERREYALRLFDIRARAYLELVSDMRMQKAYATVITEFSHAAWWDEFGYPKDVLPPPGHPSTLHITRRAQHWIKESYRKLADQPRNGPKLQLDSASVGGRRGYRQEVRAWMSQKGMTSVRQAAKRLRVSDSTLKSVMSDKGDIRYSRETLARILNELGHRESGE